ncbi:hypothetical protein [Nonomuraea sp. NPDC049400]|uniref:hypothetical protein n=1 Tax=Nonomuraea sp. NPDC049400 TaxID=3364352 RepID=UPI0037BD332B
MGTALLSGATGLGGVAGLRRPSVTGTISGISPEPLRTSAASSDQTEPTLLAACSTA